MSCSSQLISNLYTSRKTLLELLEIRGFDISKHNNFSNNEIRVMFSEKQLDFDLENKEVKQDDENVEHLLEETSIETSQDNLENSTDESKI